MRVLIAVIAGPHQGQVFRFAGHDVFLVGRSKNAHFRLPHTDEYFSRLHFLVEINPPHCRLMDLGSTNGTYVQGKKVTQAMLQDGDLIQALDFRHGHTVALKTVIPERQCGAAEVERFLREARILEQLDHPHIVAFREMGELCGQLYFAMDFVAGVDAKALLDRDGPLPISRAVHLIAQALEALHHAHQRGFVHRDVKPANLLVVSQGGEDMVKVLDFGLARAYQMSRLSGLSMLGQVGGTVPFMAPEQLTNFRDARPPVDQFAAAATLYNLLTGKYIHDFPRDFEQRFLKVLQDDPVPLRTRRSEVSESVAAVIHRALDRKPENRFPDAAAFRAALLQAVSP